ncbi:unnamed protein product (macronuclear) [Paramecium tetraurelia]|uniref:Uncharacterized protein n=1 Tax=Paramecium tetraurelia TaxID=5888 RepID=A0BSS0_PARTE|nr:uncharacterized protein GSPATT00031819001 [Paramecium tetraurelia]CAK61587.1 unnamed protein product [Paramecium tetraurelia]|eukprot:XP_001428985.1 hypothetical protein (macronuclear) [Paramecium tetraurelia strain d4-2]
MKKNSKKVHKVENYSKPKTENRGKPSQLKNIQLEAPEIWTNSPPCVRLVKYLSDMGRHNYLHQAGKHSNKVDNNKRQENDLDTKLRYEYAQEIVEKLFSIQCESKRCFVFFFRSVDQEKVIYDFQEYIQNQEFLFIIHLIQPLLSQKFIEDLISILNSQDNSSSAVDLLLQSKDDPSKYSHIVQNFFIQKQLQTGLDKKTNKPNIEEVINEFEEFLKDPQTNQLVYDFVSEILRIFQSSTAYLPDINEMCEVVNDFQCIYQ